MHVHFDAIVLTALFIRWLEGAAIGWAGESEDFIETIAKAAEGAVGAVDRTIRPASVGTISIIFANDLLWDFNEAVENVADTAAQFAS